MKDFPTLSKKKKKNWQQKERNPQNQQPIYF